MLCVARVDGNIRRLDKKNETTIGPRKKIRILNELHFMTIVKSKRITRRRRRRGGSERLGRKKMGGGYFFYFFFSFIFYEI